MDPNIDISKLVGAASAPVALIIASCIYLGNLSQKYYNLFERIRTLSQEIREKSDREPPSPEEKKRESSIKEQLRLYEYRIYNAMRCTFWLNIAIICFIATVLLTAANMLSPKNVALMSLTAGVMSIGLLIVAGAIALELWSNRLARPILKSELTVGTPQYQPAISNNS